MTRHGKNSTASSVYTYHERQKDRKQSGWGTLKARLGKDSLNEFDCCSLTLQPAKDPVLTPEGHLYDKQAILEYILAMRKENNRKKKEYEKAMAALAAKDEKTKAAMHDKAIQQLKAAAVVASPAIHATAKTGDTPSVSNMAGRKRKEVPSYWIPDQADKRARISEEDDMSGTPVAPDMKVYCPMSGKPLSLKTLFPVKFTPLPEDDQPKSDVARKNRYMCAITHDALTNTTPCVFMKPSGAVITKEAFDKIIKADMTDPTTGDKLTESDIIELRRGGTGFAKVNEEALKAEHARPSAQCQ